MWYVVSKEQWQKSERLVGFLVAAPDTVQQPQISAHKSFFAQRLDRAAHPRYNTTIHISDDRTGRDRSTRRRRGKQNLSGKRTGTGRSSGKRTNAPRKQSAAPQGAENLSGFMYRGTRQTQRRAWTSVPRAFLCLRPVGRPGARQWGKPRARLFRGGAA